MRVNFGGNKFKKLEDDEFKEKKKKDNALSSKKKLLLDEFCERDELQKNTDIQLDRSSKAESEVRFKGELDSLIEKGKKQQLQLSELEKKLSQIQNNTYEGNSMFSSAMTSTNNNNKRQFSTIFSQSYYRSGNFATLGLSQMQNKQEIEQYLEKMQEEIIIAENNIENEEERKNTIQNQLHQLFKTKQKLKQSIHEIETMETAAEKRFEGLDRIEHVAVMKKTVAFQQLSKAKNQISEQDTLRQNILSRQGDQLEKEQADKKENEELTGGILLKIDEQKILLEETEKTLKQVQIEEKKIVKKRMKSKYILKYIEFFDHFKELFLKKKIDEETIERLYEEQREIQSHSMKNLEEVIKESNTEGDGGNSTYKQERSYPQLLSPDPQNRGQRINRNELNNSPKGDKLRTLSENSNHKSQDLLDLRKVESIQQDQEVERTELINKINKFLDEYPLGLDTCVNQVLKLLNEQRYKEETNNELYQILLKDKTQMTQDLLQLSNDYEELQKNNAHIEAMLVDEEEEQKQEAIEEALDSGFIRLPQHENLIGDKRNNIRNFTTVNALRHADETSFLKKEEEINQNKNFFFNFFMSYGESMLRISRVIKTMFKTVLQSQYSPAIHKKCQDAIKYIQQIWSESERNQEFTDFQQGSQIQIADGPTPIAKQSKRLQGYRNSIDGQAGPQEVDQMLSSSNNIENKKNANNNGAKKRILLEKFTFEEIKEMFTNIFGNDCKQYPEEFFKQLKNDRLVWFFCDTETIYNYLTQIYQIHFPKKSSRKSLIQNNTLQSELALQAVDYFHELENEAKKQSNNKLDELYNHLTGLINKIKQENLEIEENLKQKGIQFKKNFIPKSSEIQPNLKITSAVDGVVKRQKEYKFAASDALAEKEDMLLANAQVAPQSQSMNMKLQSQGEYGWKDSMMNSKEVFGESEDAQKLLSIVEYVNSAPSSKQREAHKKHYSSTPNILVLAEKSQPKEGQNQSSQQSTLQQVMFPQQSTSNNIPIPQQKDQVIQNQQSQNSGNPYQLAPAGGAFPIIPSSQQSSHQQQKGQQLPNLVLQNQSSFENKNQSIPKNKQIQKNTSEQKCLFDLNEDTFIQEESKKQKERERLQHLELLQKEKEKEKKSLKQQQSELEPNAQFKIIQNLNQRLTSTSKSENQFMKNMRHFSLTTRVLSKIDRLEKNEDSQQYAQELFNTLRQQKHKIYHDVVMQEQDQILTDKIVLLSSRQNQASGGGVGGDINQEDDDSTLNKNKINLNPLFPPKTLTHSTSYLKSTTAMNERKKLALQTLRELESQKFKASSISFGNAPRSTSNYEEEKKNEINNSKIKIKTKTSPSTASRSHSSNWNQQLFGQQTIKFYTRYTDGDKLSARDPFQSGKPNQNKGTNHSKSQSQHAFSNPNQKQMSTTEYGKFKRSTKPDLLSKERYLATDAQITNLNEINKAPDFVDFPFFSSNPLTLNGTTSHQYKPTGLLSNLKQNSLGASPENRMQYF